jgi:hypothetical protein
MEVGRRLTGAGRDELSIWSAAQGSGRAAVILWRGDGGKVLHGLVQVSLYLVRFCRLS